MLKKMLFISAIVGVSSFAVAQKAVKGDKGFTFGASGINAIGVNTSPSSTNSLMFKYLFADDMAARVGIMFGRTGTNKVDTLTPGVKTTTTDGNSNWSLSLGVQKSFGSNAKLVPFVGADLLVGGTNMGTNEVKKEVTATTGGTVGDTQDSKKTYGSKFIFGLVPVVGFDYFFTDHFAFGAEFGYGYKYSSNKEESTVVTNTGTSFGIAGSTTTGSGTSTNSTSTLGTTGTGTISVSVYF